MIKRIATLGLLAMLFSCASSFAADTRVTLPTLSACSAPLLSTDIWWARHGSDVIDCKATGVNIAAMVYGVAPSAFSLPTSGSLPGTCTAGQIYLNSGAATGKRLYACETTNTWVLQGDGNGAGYVDPLSTKGDLLVYGSATSRLGVGASGQVPSANSNDSLGITWQDSGPSIPGYASARWYTTPSGNTFSTGASSAGGTTAYVTPFYVAKRTTFTDIGVWVTAATGTKIHLAVYSGKPVIGQVMTLVAGSDGEDASLSIGGMDTVTFGTPVTLDKGWYGLEVFPNGAVTMNTLASGITNYMEGMTDLNTTAPKLGAAGQTYGTLNSITLAIVNDASNPYAIGLKAQ